MIRVFVSAPPGIARTGLETVIRESSGLALAGGPEDSDVLVGIIGAAEDELPGEILSAAARSAVVVLAAEPQPAWVAEALRAAVRGVLPAGASPEEIVAAIEAAANGLVVLDPNYLPALASPAAAAAPGLDSGQPLTPREIDVLRLMAEGEPNKGIAWRLGISEHTVKFHVASIMGKLQASSRTEAVTLGIRRGLILL